MQQAQGQQSQWSRRVRIILFVCALLTLITGAAIWIMNSLNSTPALLTTIFGAVTTLIAFIQLIPIIFPPKAPNPLQPIQAIPLSQPVTVNNVIPAVPINIYNILPSPQTAQLPSTPVTSLSPSPEEALSAYEQAIRLDPNAALFPLTPGEATNHPLQTQQLLSTYRSTHKTGQEWLDEGNLLQHLKRYEEALAAYDQAILFDPNFALAYNGKGNALRGLKRYEEALTEYGKAIRLDPNLVVAYNGKGAALHSLKRYEEALTEYDQAIRLDPNLAATHNAKGTAFHSLKQYKEALIEYEKAIRLDPNLAVAHNGRGNALRGLKRYEEALIEYDQAIRLDPNLAVAYSGKGYTLENMGKTNESKQFFEKALQLGY